MAESGHPKKYEASTSDPIVLLEWVVLVESSVWWDHREAQLRRKEGRREGKSRREVADVESVQHGPE